MKNLQTFEEFLNENLNEAFIEKEITIDNFFRSQDSKTFRNINQSILDNCLNFIGEKDTKKVYLITNRVSGFYLLTRTFFIEMGIGKDITKEVCGSTEGPDGKGSSFLYNEKGNIIKYVTKANSPDTFFIISAKYYDEMDYKM
jgi:hypothetical protein